MRVTLLAVVPRIRHRDQHALIATHKNLLIGVYWDFAVLEHIPVLRQSVQDILAEHDDGFATVVVVTGQRMLQGFNAEVRQGLADLVADTQDTGLATAFVVRRDGFVGAAVRSVLSGLFLFGRSREPNAVFPAVPRAASWLEEHLTGPSQRTLWEPGEVQQTLLLAERQAHEGDAK